MSHKTTSFAICTLLALATLSSTGCVTSAGPNLGLLSFPIPGSPYFQKMKEDDFWNHERYERVPVLGPIPAGGPAVALDPPSDDEVVRALEKARPTEGGLPFMHEVQRNRIRIVKEKIADYVGYFIISILSIKVRHIKPFVLLKIGSNVVPKGHCDLFPITSLLDKSVVHYPRTKNNLVLQGCF